MMLRSCIETVASLDSYVWIFGILHVGKCTWPIFSPFFTVVVTSLHVHAKRAYDENIEVLRSANHDLHTACRCNPFFNSL